MREEEARRIYGQVFLHGCVIVRSMKYVGSRDESSFEEESTVVQIRLHHELSSQLVAFLQCGDDNRVGLNNNKTIIIAMIILI